MPGKMRSRYFYFGIFFCVSVLFWLRLSRQKYSFFDEANSNSHNVIIMGESMEDTRKSVDVLPKKFDKEVLVKQACRIPKLDINHPSVAHFFKNVQPLICDSEPNWAYVENGHFFITDDAVMRHGSISCSHLRFWRISDHKLGEKRLIYVKNGSVVEESDYFRAECTAKDGKSWRNLFATIVPKKERIEELKRVKKHPDWSGLNVYFVGFDSVSRLTFQRKMKKSFAFLTNNLEAIVLRGYNIVGDGTPQAFIPILTNQTELELPLTRKRYENANYVDVYPMIWRNFSEKGYATLYAEDSAAVGTFTYRLKGFNQQPTDHYMRTFFQMAEKELENSKCIGSEPQHKVWFRYGEQFFAQYPKEIPKFSLMHHSVLSHGDVNTLQMADDDFEEHLQKMKIDGHLDDTLLIVMADHGHRFAKLRETHQGQLEERLPFFALILPEKFRKGRGELAWKNLRINAERLTTPFDIYSTLADLLIWPSKSALESEQNPGIRSLSLWHPVPLNRTCSQAGIEPHWCTCLNWESAQGYQQQVDKIAQAVVQKINSETEPERKLCASLKLTKIEDAKRLVPHKDLLRYKDVKDMDGFVPDFAGNTKLSFSLYQIRLRTEPGHALYEITAKYDEVSAMITVDLKSMSHINKYGDNPHCIIDKNYFLATYCVCYDRIDS